MYQGKGYGIQLLALQSNSLKKRQINPYERLCIESCLGHNDSGCRNRQNGVVRDGGARQVFAAGLANGQGRQFEIPVSRRDLVAAVQGW